MFADTVCAVQFIESCLYMCVAICSSTRAKNIFILELLADLVTGLEKLKSFICLVSSRKCCCIIIISWKSEQLAKGKILKNSEFQKV